MIIGGLGKTFLDVALRASHLLQARVLSLSANASSESWMLDAGFSYHMWFCRAIQWFSMHVAQEIALCSSVSENGLISRATRVGISLRTDAAQEDGLYLQDAWSLHWPDMLLQTIDPGHSLGQPSFVLCRQALLQAAWSSVACFLRLLAANIGACAYSGRRCRGAVHCTI